MADLITEVLGFLAIAALLGLLLGYLIWGYGRARAIRRARADGARLARTSVDGSEPLRAQLDTVMDERDALRAELAQAQLDARHSGPREEEPAGVQPGFHDAPAPEPIAAEALQATFEPMERVEPEPEPAMAEHEPIPVAVEPTPEEPAAPATLLTEAPDETDDLKRIKGVGPKMESILNAKGVYLFHQIANFTPADVAWVNEAIEAFPGRIERDRWVAQAQDLCRDKYGESHDA